MISHLSHTGAQAGETARPPRIEAARAVTFPPRLWLAIRLWRGVECQCARRSEEHTLPSALVEVGKGSLQEGVYRGCLGVGGRRGLQAPEAAYRRLGV
jgi:hypothetical protein